MSEIKIKECPYCGAEASLYPYDYCEEEWTINCDAPWTECNFMLQSTRKETLVELWNSMPRTYQ